MKLITLRNGKVLIESDLIEFTKKRKSEDWIAAYYGISRMALWKWRVKLNIPKKRKRCDKGQHRNSMSDAERKQKRNDYMRDYMREYRQRDPKKHRRNWRKTRSIFEQVVGRMPKNGEIVHHIDGNPLNNKHSNLVICTQKYHMSVLHKLP